MQFFQSIAKIFLAIGCTTALITSAWAQQKPTSEFDIAGFKLSFTESKLRQHAEKTLGQIKWSNGLEERSNNGHLKSKFYWGKIPENTADEISYRVNSEGKVSTITYESKFHSNATLDSILEPAFKKYGKPFRIVRPGKQSNGSEMLAASWAVNSKGTRIVDYDFGHRECNPHQISSAPDCRWEVTFAAERMADGSVKVFRQLTAPILIWNVSNAGKGEGPAGIRY